MPRQDAVLVGVDIGATKVAAYEIVRDEFGGTLDAGRVSASVEFTRVADFRPLAIFEQERQAERGALDLTEAEREQARIWLTGTARSIAAVARARRRSLALIGIAAPGRKSEDGSGLVVVRNGPRIPELTERLERQLRRDGVELLAPLDPLYSDGVTGCLGEARSASGGLHDCQRGYYLGGGTGIAEAVLVEGEALALDSASVGLPPAWLLRSEAGPVYEDLISMRAVRASELPPTELAGHIVDFLIRRVEALERGCERNLRPSRIVLGQALGVWLSEDPTGRAVGAEVQRALAERSVNSIPLALCCPLVFSSLRPAPAIGAADLAFQRLRPRSTGRAHGPG